MKPEVKVLKKTSTEARNGLGEELLINGIVFLTGTVSSEMSYSVGAQLLYWSRRDPKKELTLYINSPGGSVHDGLAIIDMCKAAPNPIATVGWGLCASMGAMLLSCAGDKGNRLIYPSCEVMQHQPLTGVQGQASDIAITAKQVLRMKERLYTMIAESCGQSIRKVTRDFDRDRWFTAQEALEYGMVDEIVKPGKPVSVPARRER